MFEKIQSWFKPNLKFSDIMEMTEREWLKWDESPVIIDKKTGEITIKLHEIKIKQRDYETGEFTGNEVLIQSMPNAIDILDAENYGPFKVYNDLNAMVAIEKKYGDRSSGLPLTIATIKSNISKLCDYDIPSTIIDLIFDIYQSEYPDKKFSRE